MNSTTLSFLTKHPRRGGYAPQSADQAAAHSIQLCNVACVTGVRPMRMSLSRLQGAGISVDALQRLFSPESVKDSVDVAAKSEPHVIELSTLQKIALLRMNRSTLCRGIATHLQNENDLQSKPSIFDYRALVAHGLAYKQVGDDWHKITPLGMSEATRIARELAKKLGVHLLLEGGNEGAQATYRCACGAWTGSYQRGQFALRNAMNGFARHCAKESPTREAESA